MKKPLFAIIYSIPLCLLLMGCTDVRERLSPEVLAVDMRETGAASLAIRCPQAPEEIISARADSPLLVCTALRAAAGKEIDAGHISLLLLRGSPAALLPDLLAKGALMPTSEVLLCRDDPCAMPETLPDAEQLRAAAAAGMLPARTADLILGDLQNGSGVSALPAMQGDRLTLALCDSEGQCGFLSEDACRGLALLGKRWESFSFRAGETVVTAKRTHLRLSAAEDDAGALHFTLAGSVACVPEGIPHENWLPDAEAALTELLRAACEEPVHQSGADLLLLRETAVRDGISGAADCTCSAWRERLLHADFAIKIAAEPAFQAGIG